jgi:histidinol-phosphatase
MTLDRQLAEDLALAQRLAATAAQIALRHLSRAVPLQLKPDGTPVSEADIEIERCLLGLLTRQRPDDAILGAEFGAHPGLTSAGRQWLIDPIEATSNYAAGQAAWGTHIALSVHGEIMLGIITRPAVDRCWWATQGGGAHRSALTHAAEPIALQVSQPRQLSQSRVSISAGDTDARAARIKAAAQWVEPDPNALLDLVEGKLEVWIASAGKPWAHAPALIVVEEAGGRFVDRHGGRRIDIGEARYDNGRIDEELLELLAG